MPPSGSATSSRRVSSRREMSTLDQLSMFSHPTFGATPGATSSPASASGTMPWASQAGPRTGPSGPDRAPANLSPRQAAEAGLLTSGTSGRRGITSSQSADLQRSLANRLRARTASTGSTLFTLTWTALATPSGLLICALRASARRTSGSAPGSWPTPCAVEPLQGGQHQRTIRPRSQRGGGSAPNLATVASMASWPTPQANDGTGANSLERQARRRQEAPKRKGGGAPGFANLRDAAQLAAWATPAARDYRHANAQSFAERGGGKKGEQLNNQVVHLASWPTPMADTPAQKGYNEAGNTDSSRKTVALCLTDGPARITVAGTMLTGSSAGMTGGGQLSPAHSRWLMGLPSGWDRAAPLKASRGSACSRATATRSTRKLPRPL